MTPITTQTEQQHRYPEEIELQQMETEDEAERLSPLTQSASSILRDDLARFQQQELRSYYDATRHGRPSASRTMQPLTPIYNDCYYPWQPPMAHPPTPTQPTEPAPELSRTHRIRMNMRVNLPPTEDQQPRKISRQNSRTDQVDVQNPTEADHGPHCCTSARDPQGQETEVYETSFPTSQQPQRQLQAEAMEQAIMITYQNYLKSLQTKRSDVSTILMKTPWGHV